MQTQRRRVNPNSPVVDAEKVKAAQEITKAEGAYLVVLETNLAAGVADLRWTGIARTAIQKATLFACNALRDSSSGGE